MTKLNVKSIKEAFDTEFNKLFVHKAYIEFYFDSQHREAVLKPIQRIPLVLRIKSLQQSFILNKVDHYLNGKPVYKLIYGYPLAVQSNFTQTTKEVKLEILELDSEKVNNTIIKMKECFINSVDKSVLLEIDNLKNKKDKSKVSIINTHILEKRDVEKNSSFELDTWLQTSYNNVLLRIKNMDIRIIAVWIMSIISTIFATWIVADDYFEAHYRAKFKGSLLIPISNYLIGVLSLCRMIFFLV
ncbi:MAG: hypothetical protein E3J52_05830 [Promethearchaeota archaeon]|nr:MAG: hypothetical protein E3J52_05830 [Candidatus Lokiarchaeota archaeon]